VYNDLNLRKTELGKQAFFTAINTQLEKLKNMQIKINFVKNKIDTDKTNNINNIIYAGNENFGGGSGMADVY
jgi:hypothetical protein